VIVVLGDGADDGAGYDPARSLVQGLRQLGEVVALAALAPGMPSTDDVTTDEVMTLACAMTSGAEVAEVLTRAEDAAGPLRAVVLVSAGRASTVSGELAGLDPTQWHERVEIPLQRTVACFQGAYRRLRGRGGCLVVVVPTVSLVGSAGFVPWAAVAEAQRALAKSAGRAWGHERITVNCVAVSGALLASPVSSEDPVAESRGGGGPGPDRPGLPPPSLDRSPDMASSVAPVVASLVAGGWTSVTGATIAVDGGVWMTP
jgi:3-oxoacyl-[acyl-carrier protein] reductase